VENNKLVSPESVIIVVNVKVDVVFVPMCKAPGPLQEATLVMTEITSVAIMMTDNQVLFA
jgi:hypothetical protein